MTEQEQTERRAVVDEALSWRGTRYCHMGRIKRTGPDIRQQGGVDFKVAPNSNKTLGELGQRAPAAPSLSR